MSGTGVADSTRHFSRRAVLKCTGLVTGALLVPWVRALPARIPTSTVALHMDQPFIDVMEAGLDYRPRGFLGGASPLRSLSDEEWRRLHPYL
jgi:hypothetical protein